MRFGRDGEICELLAEAGLGEIVTGALDVEASYEGFDDFWLPFLTGEGPAGSFCASLDSEQQAALREDLRARLGSGKRKVTLPRWSSVANDRRGYAPRLALSSRDLG